MVAIVGAGGAQPQVFQAQAAVVIYATTRAARSGTSAAVAESNTS